MTEDLRILRIFDLGKYPECFQILPESFEHGISPLTSRSINDRPKLLSRSIC